MTSTLRAQLPDHASDTDARDLPLEQVGIRELTYPVSVLDRQHELQHTIATVEMAVSLPADRKGTHMSRFVEVLDGMRGEMTIRRLPELLQRIQRRLESTQAFVKLRFPYFIEKSAPVSGLRSLMEYTCSFEAKAHGADTEFELGVEVPVTTLCPCSKAISEYGAHNQRTIVAVRLQSSSFVWLEDVVEAVELCASSPVYALLKREDEKFVTEAAYDKPVFVEDLCRDVVLSLRNLPGIHSLSVEATSAESIHKHAAYAGTQWRQSDEPRPKTEAKPLRRYGQGFHFGQWLKERRQSLQLSQGEMARRLDLSPSFLSRLESGDKRLPRELANTLAGVLGLETALVELRAGHVPEGLAEEMAAEPERFLAFLKSRD